MCVRERERARVRFVKSIGSFDNSLDFVLFFFIPVLIPTCACACQYGSRCVFICKASPISDVCVLRPVSGTHAHGLGFSLGMSYF